MTSLLVTFETRPFPLEIVRGKIARKPLWYMEGGGSSPSLPADLNAVKILQRGAMCGAHCVRDSKGNSGTRSVERDEFPGPRGEFCDGKIRALGSIPPSPQI